MNNIIAVDQIIGRWMLVKTDGTIDIGDKVEMTISSDGKIEYRIHDKSKIQIINLTYRLEDNILITDQLSAPREERTSLSLDKDCLILSYQDSISWFKKMV